MLPFLSITFREFFEIVFVLIFIFCFIEKTKQYFYKKYVYLGIVSGILAVLVLGVLFSKFLSFIGSREELFEAVFMIVVGFLLTYMIVWINRYASYVQKLKNNIVRSIEKKKAFDIFFIVFITVLREGLEMVILLETIAKAVKESYLYSLLIGAIIAISVGYLVYRNLVRFDVKRVFLFITVVLILFTAGIFSQGVGELQEINVLPVYMERFLNVDSNTVLYKYFLSSDSYFSIFLKSVFGYDTGFTFLQFATYFSYIFIFWVFFALDKKKKSFTQLKS